MLYRPHGTITTIGFARYEALDGVTPEQVMEAAAAWRRSFLASIDGVSLHCLLRNTRGHYADILLATSPATFSEIETRHQEDATTEAFLKLLRPESIRLRNIEILTPDFRVPHAFAAVEFGSFRPREQTADFADRFVAISEAIKDDYLAKQAGNTGYAVGRADDGSFVEICFGRSLGETREICAGYESEPVCKKLIELCDPASVDLDFWAVLA